MATWKVIPYKKWPILESTEWDADEAIRAMRKWASSDGSGEPDTIDWAKYRQGFTSYDTDNAEIFGAYKFPHHNIEGDGLVTDREGVFTAYGFLDKADMPQEIIDGMRAHLDKHYADMDMTPPSERAGAWIMDEPIGGGGGMIEHRGIGFILDRQGDTGPVDGNAAMAALFSQRVGIPTDNIFIFPLQPSTQAVDSYYTRMSAQSLKNYQRNAIAGVPFMNSHRTDACFTNAELPLGQSFDGNLSGTPTDETPIFKRGNIPDPDKVDLFSLGMTLQTMDYMKAGIFPNGRNEPGTDDIIDMIESKTLRQVSIGFGHAAPDRILYVCGLCGNPVGQKSDDPELQCSHVPGFRSKDTGHVAFAWVRNGQMYEHSGVWAGATPGAIVGHAPTPLVMQARMVAANGLLTAEEVDVAEGMYGVKVKPGTQFAPGVHYGHREVKTVADKKKEEGVVVEPGEGLVQNEEPCDKVEMRSVRDQLSGIAETLERSIESTNNLLAALVEQRAEANVTTVELEANGLTEGLESVATRLEVVVDKLSGVEQEQKSKVLDARALLVERVVQASVRAYGQLSVDAVRLEKMLSALDEQEINDEVKRIEALNPFKAGRQAHNAESPGGVGRSSKKINPSEYRVGA